MYSNNALIPSIISSFNGIDQDKISFFIDEKSKFGRLTVIVSYNRNNSIKHIIILYYNYDINDINNCI